MSATYSQITLLPAIPELFDPNFLDHLLPQTSTAKEHVPFIPSHPMMDALNQFSHRKFTANGAHAYDSTLSPTLDAFHCLSHFSWSGTIEHLLGELQAWNEDPQLTLKIIWNLRSIHDGKSDREGFYRAFGWLYDNHPRTAITNLHLLVEPVCSQGKSGKEPSLPHGYWKDLLNILALATVDELSNLSQPARFLHNYTERGQRNVEANAEKAQRAAAGQANHARLERKLQDPKFRALYIAVARLFAQRLLVDWRHLLDAETAQTADARKAFLRNISLASKWAPTPGATHDRHTNIASAIGRLIYQGGKDTFPTIPFPSALANQPALETPEATTILRSFYRRWLLTPLRAASMVIETFMSANRWKEIPYSRVSSACMKNNQEHFFKHDPNGFQKYLISVEKGSRTISGATLLAHQILGEVFAASGTSSQYPELQKHREELAEVKVRVLEAQWKTLLRNLREAGKIDNAIAVCDVSGSMGELTDYSPKRVDPIFPAISLSLLFAQLAEPPFDGGFITFSSDPEIVRLSRGMSLREAAEKMVSVNWGMSTNIQAVFLRLLLPLAIQHGVKKEDMIKRVFVFSDMQFDQGTQNPGAWETNYDVIEREFQKAGYEVPEIVYWNLGEYGTVEVLKDRKGVALMSGFSPSMLKVFMGEEEDIEMMEVEQDGFEVVKAEKKTLAKTSFDRLVVVD
ncbi:hypothetical protein R3P38DRAFT_3326058 [Favolaschia claudopus]|uniref:DUF2828 domain-containing protein n=1 Tax=Favolaschia claudopus TaxID=2862362 RepID=A0AAW0ACD9_9AGAR